MVVRLSAFYWGRFAAADEPEGAEGEGQQEQRAGNQRRRLGNDRQHNSVNNGPARRKRSRLSGKLAARERKEHKERRAGPVR